MTFADLKPGERFKFVKYPFATFGDKPPDRVFVKVTNVTFRDADDRDGPYYAVPFCWPGGEVIKVP